jgi:hypothetical protein
MTIVEDTRVITGGVDTHAGMHVAAALDPLGGLLGGREVPAAAAGYAGLLSWLGGFGGLALAGVEGTGSYGAGLARYLAAAGIRVVEADRADRQDRRRQGKSDPLDASAGRGPRRPAGQPGRPGAGTARGLIGAVLAISIVQIIQLCASHRAPAPLWTIISLAAGGLDGGVCLRIKVVLGASFAFTVMDVRDRPACTDRVVQAPRTPSDHQANSHSRCALQSRRR